MRKPKRPDDVPATTDRIARAIGLLRGQKVMLDFDLAVLYGVETKALKRAVKRNLARFPGDFMFELTEEEFDNLRVQSGASRWSAEGTGDRHCRPAHCPERVRGVALHPWRDAIIFWSKLASFSAPLLQGS